MCMGACTNSRSCSLKWKDARAECGPGRLLACVTALVTAEGGDMAVAAAGAPLCWVPGSQMPGAQYCAVLLSLCRGGLPCSAWGPPLAEVRMP